MINLATFRVRFAEFAETSDALVNDALARAESEIDPAVWEVHEDQGHGLLAAHKLAIAPFGGTARVSLDPKKRTTTSYMLEFEALRDSVVCGLRP